MTRPDRDADVRVTRRAVLRGSSALPAFLTLHACARAEPSDPAAPPAPAPSPSPGDVAAFVERWGQRALELAARPRPNEDRFLHELVAGLAALDQTALPSRRRTSYDRDGLQIGPVAGNDTFQVLEIELAPHAVIRPHNHVGYCFATLGMAGEILARHFEVEGQAPAPGSDLDTRFVVREVSSSYLTPGRTSTLTRARANIHTFVAGPDGARIMDFGVAFGDPGPGPTSFSVLEIDTSPADRGQRTYGARWLGNVYAKQASDRDSAQE